MAFKRFVTHHRVDLAHQHLNKANDELQDALRGSGFVDGILLQELIEKLANVRVDVSNLAIALKQDALP